MVFGVKEKDRSGCGELENLGTFRPEQNDSNFKLIISLSYSDSHVFILYTLIGFNFKKFKVLNSKN